jgi:hypothetical protein
MPRSGDLLDAKVFEADFFFEKLKTAGLDFFAARCYFSAFVSAARSISFAMQAVLKDVEGFPQWYAERQQRLRGIPLARFFVTVRNETQKIGHSPVNSGASQWLGNGQWDSEYYFVGGYEGDVMDIPSSDIVTACSDYMKLLVELVYDCYNEFNILSPQSFFSVSNLRRLGLSLEDVEETLGFPRGWTAAPGIAEDMRLKMLRESVPDSAIDRVFLKYLEKTRMSDDNAT